MTRASVATPTDRPSTAATCASSLSEPSASSRAASASLSVSGTASAPPALPTRRAQSAAVLRTSGRSSSSMKSGTPSVRFTSVAISAWGTGSSPNIAVVICLTSSGESGPRAMSCTVVGSISASSAW